MCRLLYKRTLKRISRNARDEMPAPSSTIGTLLEAQELAKPFSRRWHELERSPDPRRVPAGEIRRSARYSNRATREAARSPQSPELPTFASTQRRRSEPRTQANVSPRRVCAAPRLANSKPRRRKRESGDNFLPAPTAHRQSGTGIWPLTQARGERPIPAMPQRTVSKQIPAHFIGPGAAPGPSVRYCAAQPRGCP